jgi:CheY-like chemotaxis protein
VKPLVLIVDDDDVGARAAVMILESGGFSAVSVPSGEIALKLLNHGLRPAVIVSDMILPGIDGNELVRRARELLGSAAHIVTTTGWPSLVSQETQRNAEVAEKPMDASELLGAVRRAMGGAEVPPQSESGGQT